MVESDKPDFGRVMLGLAGIYRLQLTPEQAELYWNALSHLPLETFREYANRAVRECEFMPRPADFTKYERVDNGRTWAEAWNQILANHGSTDDPVGQRALRNLGGWRVIGFTNAERLPWLAERFREHYECMTDAARPLLAHENGGQKRLT